MKLLKSDIVRKLPPATGFSRKKSAEAVNALLEVMIRTLESGDYILISNFGKFYIKEKKARRWRNPATGIVSTLKPKRVAAFKCSKKLKTDINTPDNQPGRRLPAPRSFSVPGRGSITTKDLKAILKKHRRWLKTMKKKGKRASLISAKLKHVDFYAAFLSGADLQAADLSEADLTDAELVEANLQSANLYKANLMWANLEGANLQGASLQKVDLRWANLVGANLTDADLRGANLEGANLRETKFLGADLNNVKLKNTNMEYANLLGIKLDTATHIDLPLPLIEEYT